MVKSDILYARLQENSYSHLQTVLANAFFFSEAGQIDNAKRKNLSPENIEQIVVFAP